MESQKDKPRDIEPELDGHVEDVQHDAEKLDDEKTESHSEVAAETSVEGPSDLEETDSLTEDVVPEESLEASLEVPPTEVPTIVESSIDESETVEMPRAVEVTDAPTEKEEADPLPLDLEPSSEVSDAQESTETSIADVVEETGGDEALATSIDETTSSAVPEEKTEAAIDPPQTTVASNAEGSTGGIEIETSSVEDTAVEVEKSDEETPKSVQVESEPAPAKDEAQSHDRDVEHDHEPHHEEEHHDDHEDEIDYEHLEKDQIEEHLAQISRDDDIRKIDRHLKPIKARFDLLFATERAQALEKFLAEGFEEEDFEYREDDQSQKIHAYLELLRDKRQKFYADRERQKEDNLKKKEEILEKIRELIDGEESDISIKGVKELQEEWKSIGPVPGQHNKTLWANYNALLDRFYDARSIYFELKDLDRKKNLKLKLDICERAEALDQMDNIKEAVVQLNELHEEFKHVGPIPRDEQETVWQRFKSASDKIYVKRKDFVDELKKSLLENFEKKMTLADEAEKFISFESDRISEWNKRTKEIQELQRRWEAVGGVPRDKAKLVNKKFWGGFKQFFAHKSAFFKKFEAQREDNLKKKQELVQRAEEMKESSDWQSTTEQFKKLQAEWKDIGPVPEKFRNSIYEEFKAACDHFFDRRRDQNKEQNQEYEENYQQKQVICNSIAQLAQTEDLDQDLLYDLIDQYNSIGFVPRNVMRKIQDRFNQVTAQVINSSALDDEDRNELKMNIEVSRLKGGPHANRKLFRKENSLKRKIDNLQNDINTWKTNMEFFASSKAADQLKKDFEVKIEQAQEELIVLRKELRLLNQ
ncbi:MAG: DUF349 domain-containing protein [Bacteroidota bacterium]